LKEKYGVHTEIVNTGLHIFLRVPRYFKNGEDLYIDPTIQQFVSPEKQNQVPVVFMGTKSELKNLLSSVGVEDIIIKMNYTVREKLDVAPSWR